MPWLPPKGLDTLKSIACNRGLWEDLGNGYVTKKPKKKCTSVQVIAESEPDDKGEVHLRINTQNTGPAPRIHYAEDGPVGEKGARNSKDQFLTTKALRVNFLVIDPSRPMRSGRRRHLDEQARSPQQPHGKRRQARRRAARRPHRQDSLHARRRGTPRRRACTTNRSRSETARFWSVPSPKPSGVEVKKDFPFAARGKKGVEVDDVKPGRLVSRTGRKLDSRGKTFEGLKQAAEKSVTFENVTVNVGSGTQVATFFVGEIPVERRLH